MKVIKGYSTMCKWIDRIIQVIAVAILVFIVSIVFSETVARYVFSKSLRITDEIVSFLMPWLAMLGAGIAMRRKELVFINAQGKCPVWVRKIAALISDILILLLLLWCVKSGMTYVSRNAAQTSATMRISMAYPYLSIPCGSALMVLYTIEDILKTLFIKEKEAEAE